MQKQTNSTRFKIHLADIAPARGMSPVVNELHLDVQSGDRVALLGPSGSGKTTILRAVMGLAKAKHFPEMDDSTDIEILRRNGMIGYVPQNTLIFPWLSVIDNIRLPFMIHKQLPDDARVTQLVEALQIREFLRTEVTKLSGGMAARVATARALVLKPRLLLIDEAFAALDEFLRYEVWLNVSMEMQDGVTIFVTHSVSDAAAFASHAVVLDNKAPSRTTSVSLQPTKLSYPPLQSNTMSENITAIRHALYP